VNPRLWIPGIGGSNVLVAALGVIVMAAGSGVGLYAYSRAHQPLEQTAAPNVKAPPTPAPVGQQAPAQLAQAVLLTVVSTKPLDGTSGIATNTPITFLFNLAVTPSAVKNLLAVRASDYGDANVSGKFLPGTKPQEVVFKPTSSFGFGSSVVVTLRSGLRSLDGAELSNDYSFGFTTVAGPQTVLFDNGQRRVRLVNALSGRPITLGIETGDHVPPHMSIKTYKATAKDLLAGLVYSTSKDGYASYLDKNIDTTSMRLVDNGGTTLRASGARVTTVQSGVDVTIIQPDGIYLILAADANGQYGAAWVDFSRYGVLLRQDDQKVVMAGEDLITGETTPTFNVTFYNLANGVHSKLTGSFSGTAELPAKYPAGLDIAIATSGGQEVAVPMGAPDSGADLRVAQDLSRQPQIYLTTDRPAYLTGEAVKFAGIVRMSNDQVYTVGGGGNVTLSTLVSGTVAVVTVAANGTFSGSFRLPAAEFSSKGLDAQVTLYAGASSANYINPNALTSSTSIVAVAPNMTTNSISVSLDKESYVAGEPLVASITGTNATKQPLAGQTVSIAVYAAQNPAQPVEMDRFPSPTGWGDAIQATVKVRLDSAGHATYRMTPKIGLKATDQAITVLAYYGAGKLQAYIARTATFYQAEDEVFLLAARSSYQQGDTVSAPFVVESRGGARVAGVQLAYELVRTDYEGDHANTTVVASGTTTTDANGKGMIRSAYTGSPASLVLRIKGKDQAGRLFQDAKDLTVDVVENGTPQLDVITDKIAYSVGDTASLTVTSPTAARVLLSLERGRVHLYRWIQLNKGDNAVTLNVTPDLAPGFNVVFSSFRNGVYRSEDFPVVINNSSRLLKVTVTADQPTYAKGQIAHVSVAVADSAGAPVKASLLADGYEARMTSNLLVDHDSIAGAFLTPNRLGTNGSSSLLGIGAWGGGMCGGGGPSIFEFASGDYPGRSNVWLTNLVTDSTGRATIDVPINLPGPVRLVVLAHTPASSWGQAEIVLNVQ
jgi:Bacterial Ig-like domain/Alpha-2-macroglobulin bait region domain